jgi:hypothetical protein
MQQDFLTIIEEANALNSKIFSLIRFELMANLVIFGNDGVTYRELKAALKLNDGVLYSNLQTLAIMGYVSVSTIKYENKDLQLFKITPEGLNEWMNVRAWLCKFLNCK